MGTPPKPNPTPLPGAGGIPAAGGVAPVGAPTGGAAAPQSINLTGPGTTANSSVPIVAVPWNPSFAKFKTITFALTVTDSLNVTSTNAAQCVVTIQPLPQAAIGPNQTISAGTNITLDGSGSTGVGLKYNWTFVSGTPVTT